MTYVGPIEIGPSLLLICSEQAALAIPDLAEEERQQIAELTRRLLALGGISIHLFKPPVPHLDALLAEGNLFKGKVTLESGWGEDCFENAAQLWAGDHGRVRIATGYALTHEHDWVPHSWGVQGFSPSRKGEPRLYETNSERVKYFGVVLSQEQALEFWVENYLAPSATWPLQLLAQRKDGREWLTRHGVSLP